jgi:hypothetical protein
MSLLYDSADVRFISVDVVLLPMMLLFISCYALVEPQFCLVSDNIDKCLHASHSIAFHCACVHLLFSLHLHLHLVLPIFSDFFI